MVDAREPADHHPRLPSATAAVTSSEQQQQQASKQAGYPIAHPVPRPASTLYRLLLLLAVDTCLLSVFGTCLG